MFVLVLETKNKTCYQMTYIFALNYVHAINITERMIIVQYYLNLTLILP